MAFPPAPWMGCGEMGAVHDKRLVRLPIPGWEQGSGAMCLS